MVSNSEGIEAKIEELLNLKGNENECIEFKIAEKNFDFDDLGRYFSALSNEANLREQKEAWIVFGVSSKGELIGTSFRNSHQKLMSLKQELAQHVGNGISFIEIYEFIKNGKRILLFQIPPALIGIPTSFKGHFYGRNHESLSALSLEKIERIRLQNKIEWSAQIIKEATIENLSKEAIGFARIQFALKNPDIKEQIEQMSNEQFLNSAKITIDGSITPTALLLLGKPESTALLSPCEARITWILYDEHGKSLDYKHYFPPFILRVNEIYSNIRNLTYRHIFDDTLFPDEVKQYDADVIREVLHNCIAHQDYLLHGFISVKEFPDKLIFENPGSFIPGSINRLFENIGYTAHYYRNRFLTNAMVNLNMIDTISHGIKDIIFERQIQRGFPLPDYEFPEGMSVKATIHGRIIDENFARVLFKNRQLAINQLIALDAIQKHKTIEKKVYQDLKKKKLVEGRFPNIHISAQVASETGYQTEYLNDKGLTNAQYEQMIVNYLNNFKTASRKEIEEYLVTHLPDVLSEAQKLNKVRNLLSRMSNKKMIINQSNSKKYAIWMLPPRT